MWLLRSFAKSRLCCYGRTQPGLSLTLSDSHCGLVSLCSLALHAFSNVPQRARAHDTGVAACHLL
jgi:hypothetical protein